MADGTLQDWRVRVRIDVILRDKYVSEREWII
jgi:hypothetical protein